jgi:hypothetical protein
MYGTIRGQLKFRLMPRKGYQAVTLKDELLEILDALPGGSRPEKLERLVRGASDALTRIGSLPDEPAEAVTQYVLGQIPEWNKKAVLELAIAILSWLQENEHTDD